MEKHTKYSSSFLSEAIILKQEVAEQSNDTGNGIIIEIDESIVGGTTNKNENVAIVAGLDVKVEIKLELEEFGPLTQDHITTNLLTTQNYERSVDPQGLLKNESTTLNFELLYDPSSLLFRNVMPSQGTSQNHLATGIVENCKPESATRICKICKELVTFGDMRSHIRSVHYKNIPCPQCGMLVTKGNLKAHQRKHFKYECQSCGKSFTDLKSLDKHEKMHTGDQTYECKICKEVFGRLIYLVRHEKTHDTLSDDLTLFECGVCKKRFTRNGDLEQHGRVVHDGERPWPCKTCDQTFPWLGKLSKHEQNHHSKVKPYECGICKKKFAVITVMKAHVRMHKKAIKCDKCDMSYLPRFSSLHRIKCYNSKEPFECKECKKTFRLLGDFNVHTKRMHTETRHKCYVCCSTFSCKNSLREHKRICQHNHEKRYRYECEICKFPFTCRWSLGQHERSHTELQN